MTEATIAYRVGWLIDGSGNPAVKNRLITLNGDRILQVMDGDTPLPQSVPVIDLWGCTVFPALIDSHVHLVMSGSTEPALRQDQLDNTYATRCAIITTHLHQHLACGVLAVRDGGDHNGHLLRFKLDPGNASRSPVTIMSSGRARHAPGRYGKLIGIAVGKGMRLVESAFGRESETGRDHLKLVNSGLNSLTQFGVESPPQFDEEELAQVVREARKYGQPIMVHANGYLPVKLAIEAGCNSIEHGFFMGPENMQRMADHGVVWVPTAVTMKAYQKYLNQQGHRSDVAFADVSRQNLEHQLEQISLARQLGVTLALGTDAGSPGVHHGLAVKTELGLLIEAGYSVEGAIRCASRNGALLMGLADRGEVAPGMRADFNAVKAPPEKVPVALDRLVMQVAAGCIMDAALVKRSENL